MTAATTLMYNFAAVLGIPIEQMRITSVRTGSTIADLQILEIYSGPTNSTNDTYSNDTYSNDTYSNDTDSSDVRFG